MKTWLTIIIALFFLGGCATLDSAKTRIQGFLCPECKPAVVEKSILCPEVQPPAPTPKATKGFKRPVPAEWKTKKATPKVTDPSTDLKKDQSK